MVVLPMVSYVPDDDNVRSMDVLKTELRIVFGSIGFLIRIVAPRRSRNCASRLLLAGVVTPDATVCFDSSLPSSLRVVAAVATSFCSLGFLFSVPPMYSLNASISYPPVSCNRPVLNRHRILGCTSVVPRRTLIPNVSPPPKIFACSKSNSPSHPLWYKFLPTPYSKCLVGASVATMCSCTAWFLRLLGSSSSSISSLATTARGVICNTLRNNPDCWTSSHFVASHWKACPGIIRKARASLVGRTWPDVPVGTYVTLKSRRSIGSCQPNVRRRTCRSRYCR